MQQKTAPLGICQRGGPPICLRLACQPLYVLRSLVEGSVRALLALPPLRMAVAEDVGETAGVARAAVVQRIVEGVPAAPEPANLMTLLVGGRFARRWPAVEDQDRLGRVGDGG